MLDTLKKLLCATALILPAATFAQDDAPATTDLSTGEPVVPEVISETFGDWTVNCQELDGIERCQMNQLLRDQEGNPVIEVNLFRVADQPQVFAGGSVVAPLETLLTQQLTISIDGAQGKRYPFAFCVTSGCVSRVGLTEEDVNTYKRGASATLSIVPALAPDQIVALNMSLTGFTAAFDRLPE